MPSKKTHTHRGAMITDRAMPPPPLQNPTHGPMYHSPCILCIRKAHRDPSTTRVIWAGVCSRGVQGYLAVEKRSGVCIDSRVCIIPGKNKRHPPLTRTTTTRWRVLPGTRSAQGTTGGLHRFTRRPHFHAPSRKLGCPGYFMSSK